MLKKTNTHTAQIPRRPFNTNLRVRAIPKYSNRDDINRNGSHGVYNVTFALGIPGVNEFLENIEIDNIHQYGTSQLILPNNTEFINFKIKYRSCNYDIYGKVKNERISSLNISILADSFDDAHDKSNDIIQPILSYLAFAFDTPIAIIAVSLIEESTKAVHSRLESLGTGVQLKNRNHSTDLDIYNNEVESYFSSYREALNSNNQYYKFLCFYRIFEALRCVRERRAQSGQYTKFTNEKFPLVALSKSAYFAHYSHIFTPYIGQKFNKVFDGMATNKRHAVAHLINDDPEKHLSFNNCRSAEEYHKLCIIFNYMVRIALNNELSLQKGETEFFQYQF